MQRKSWTWGLTHCGSALGYLSGLLLASAFAGPATAAAAEPVRLPAIIESLELIEQPGRVELRLEANGAFTWTQYRDAKGNLVVELPNSTPGLGVARSLRGNSLVETVEVRVDETGARPLTKLIVGALSQSEHTLLVDQELLSILFEPTVSTAAPAVRAEGRIAGLEPGIAPGPEPLPLEPIAAPVAPIQAAARQSQRQPAGTPDAPVIAPAPTGVAATRLLGVEVVQVNDEPVLRILGDGEFRYSSFQLDSPPRFVIDLDGVVNASAQAVMTVASTYVHQVRIAQFRSNPAPVARVVLDLTEDVVPEVDRGSDGLWVRFSAASTAAARGVGPAGETQLADSSLSQVAPPEQSFSVPDTAIGAAAREAEEPVFSEPSTVLAPVEEDSSTGVTEADSEDGSEAPTAEFDAGAFSPGPAAQPEAIPERQHAVSAPAAMPSQTANSAPLTLTAPPLQIEDSTRREAPQWEPSAPVGEPVNDRTVAAAGNPPPPKDSPIGTFISQRVGTETKWTGAPVILSLKDADVTEVLRAIARENGLNIVIQPGVAGPVTVEMVDVPWDQALDQILKVNGLGMQRDGNILRVAPVAQLQQEARSQRELAQVQALSQPLSTVMTRISYARASDIARVLTVGQQSRRSLGRFGLFEDSGILSQRGSISVDERTNTLIIQELPDYLDMIIQVVRNLDIPEKQVMIEGRIVETTRNFSRTLGVNWSLSGIADAAHGNTTGLQFPNNVDATGGVSLLRGDARGFLGLTLGNVLNTFQIDVALQAAENEGLINVISAPKVAVLNNETAEIQTGLQIPIQTVVNGTVTVVFINATLRLQVKPQVTAEGTVLMDIDIQKREPQLALALPGAQNAPIATRESRTRVLVRDGGTAVIGGIYTVTTNEGADRVPGLANIPILGALFRNKETATQNQELLIFITPRVIQL